MRVIAGVGRMGSVGWARRKEHSAWRKKKKYLGEKEERISVSGKIGKRVRVRDGFPCPHRVKP